MNIYQLVFSGITMAILNAIAYHIRYDANDDLFCGFFVFGVVLADAVIIMYAIISIFNLLGTV